MNVSVKSAGFIFVTEDFLLFFVFSDSLWETVTSFHNFYHFIDETINPENIDGPNKHRKTNL